MDRRFHVAVRAEIGGPAAHGCADGAFFSRCRQTSRRCRHPLVDLIGQKCRSTKWSRCCSGRPRASRPPHRSRPSVVRAPCCGVAAVVGTRSCTVGCCVCQRQLHDRSDAAVDRVIATRAFTLGTTAARHRTTYPSVSPTPDSSHNDLRVAETATPRLLRRRKAIVAASGGL